MSVGATTLTTSVSGITTTQTSGHEAERARGEVGARHRQVYYEQKAESAGDVGELDGEDHETAERDGDGRRPWEEPLAREATCKSGARQSKDPSRQSGNLLDLTG
jgi:hypothetical protein